VVFPQTWPSSICPRTTCQLCPMMPSDAVALVFPIGKNRHQPKTPVSGHGPSWWAHPGNKVELQLEPPQKETFVGGKLSGFLKCPLNIPGGVQHQISFPLKLSLHNGVELLVWKRPETVGKPQLWPNHIGGRYPYLKLWGVAKTPILPPLHLGRGTTWGCLFPRGPPPNGWG